MKPKPRLLIFLTDAYGGRGGIAQFNRDFIEAIIATSAVEEICVLPRLKPSELGVPPKSLIYDCEAARGKLAFVTRSIAHTWIDHRTDLVICGHLHLLPVAWFVARMHRALLALVIHGIEAWEPSKSIPTNYLAGRVDQVIAVSRHTAEKFTSWSG